MKALVYYGPHQLKWEDRPDPVIQAATDVLIDVDVATVCGTDAHVSHGVHPEVPLGTVLGHEAVGTITAIGDAVTKFSIGDRVAVPPISSCGKCANCRRRLPAHCSGAGVNGNGWLLGHEIDGLQAEKARIPFADTSIHKVPDGLSSEEAILAVDVYASAQEMGVNNAEIVEGESVVVIGDGPIGIATVSLARLRNPSMIILVGIHGFRRDIATGLGADYVVDGNNVDWIDQVRALLPDGSADAVIEAVGARSTLEGAFELIGTFGRVANIGVHTEPVTFPIDRRWIAGFTFRSGLLSCTSTPDTLQLQADGVIDGTPLLSHRMQLADAVQAYSVFDNAGTTRATKIILTQ